MKTYRLNLTGRRVVALLALGALIIWLFAVWKLPDILSSGTVRFSYLHLPSTLSAIVQGGLTVSQIVPALLLIVLIVAIPLLLWHLIEEWFTTYAVREDGLLYDTIQGISVLYPWDAIKGVRQVEPESDEPVYELIVDQAGICQINSRMLRWLHRQAFGRTRIPIYAHVVDRDELLHEIVTHAGLRTTPTQSQELRTKNQKQIIGS